MQIKLFCALEMFEWANSGNDFVAVLEASHNHKYDILQCIVCRDYQIFYFTHTSRVALINLKLFF